MAKSTARVSLAEVTHLGKGLDLDLRVRPPPAPAAPGNLGFCQTCFFSGIRNMGPGNICDSSKPNYLREFENLDPDISPKSEIPKCHDPSIQNGLILR